jgi:hypothetical protein
MVRGRSPVAALDAATQDIADARSKFRDAVIASVAEASQPELLAQLDALLKLCGVEPDDDNEDAEADLPKTALAGDRRPRLSQGQEAAFYSRYPDAAKIRRLGDR